MNGSPNLILHEKILNEYPPLIVSRDGKLPAATLNGISILKGSTSFESVVKR